VKRRAFNLLAAVSLVLCVVVVVFWIRGIYRYDWFGYATHWDSKHIARYYRLASGGGAFEAYYGRQSVTNGRDEAGFTWHSEQAWGYTIFAPKRRVHHNFAFWNYSNAFFGRIIRVLVPDWILLLLCMTPMAVKCTQWLRGRRELGSSRCATCGYDLRHARSLPGMRDDPAKNGIRPNSADSQALGSD
jgi:hypothetical protein